MAAIATTEVLEHDTARSGVQNVLLLLRSSTFENLNSGKCDLWVTLVCSLNQSTGWEAAMATTEVLEHDMSYVNCIYHAYI